MGISLGSWKWVLLSLLICSFFISAAGVIIAELVVTEMDLQTYLKKTPILPSIYSFLIATSTKTPTSTLLPPTLTPTYTSTKIPTQTPTTTSTATRTSTKTKKPKPPTSTRRPTRTPTQTKPPTNTLPPSPTSNTPTPLPEAAILNIHGHWQSSTLDCESRSAADLAAYFRLQIDHMDFQTRLPKSDDPDEGFVGNYWGGQGQLPPNPYGVHAKPVARLLRAYGLNAHAKKGFSWEEIRAEISVGRPVMVWVINNTLPGNAVEYTASDQHTTHVARFEHTVLVIGYNSKYVSILDGAMVYQRTIDQFISSWSVLDHMAVFVSEPSLLK
jgi:uncharacterized protein YvpB